MAIEHNPLRQYFRRPSIYIKLPTGGTQYGPTVITLPENGELPVFPMTAIDEITLKTPDALYNGSAVGDVIKSCIPNIKDPWKLSSVDIDAILIAIRTASEGNKIEIETACPACSETSKYDINIVGCLQDINPVKYNDELELEEISIKFKPLTFKEVNEISLKQIEMQRIMFQLDQMQESDEKNKKTSDAIKKINEITLFALSKSVEYIKTSSVFVDKYEYIEDFIKNCDRMTFEKIKDYSLDLKKSTEIKPLKIQCPHCSHNYEQQFTLNMSDFFGRSF